MRGRDLRMLRIEHGVTQREVREALNCDSRHLVKIEREAVLPTPEDEERIILAIHKLSRKATSNAA